VIKAYQKKILYGVLILLLIFLFILLFFLVSNFPHYYPDFTLLIEGKVVDFFHEITLPIKLAKLSIENSEAELIMPVYGKFVSGVADTFGASRGDDRTHEGQDIFSSKGTPVFSATPGYIIRMRENSELGGNNISIFGSGGRRYYYAHLDRFSNDIKVGQKVTTDTVIGFVGNTGNAITTPDHLHFGVYFLRKPVNPLPLMINRNRT